jgi:hypothetical protein
MHDRAESGVYEPRGDSAMRFMIIRKADKNTEAAVQPSAQLIADMLKFHQEMAEAGILLGGDGLHPSVRGARIKFTNGKPVVTDGPFTEAKELIAGYTLIQVSSKAEALEWVKRWPPIDGDGNVELELRQVYEPEEIVGDASEKFREIGIATKA